MEYTSLSVSDFGATGDGRTDDTWAFEAAIEIIKKRGGGRLLVMGTHDPSGHDEVVYRLRPINLTSNMELFVGTGARIKAIPKRALWPIIPPLPSYGSGRDYVGPRYTSLIHGENLENVTIRGESHKASIIDGTGHPWWVRKNMHDENNITRGSLIEFMYSKNIQLYNIRLVNSPFWTVHPYDCDGVHAKNVHIHSPQHSPNTDGFDPDSSRNVIIEDSSYFGGDDCVAIKSGWDCFGVEYGKPARDIFIRNLTCYTSPVSIGSEISGGAENIWIEGLKFPKFVAHVAKLKSGNIRGGYIRNVTIRDVHATGTLNSSALMIDLDLYKNQLNPSCNANWTPPTLTKVQDLFFHNWYAMKATTPGHTAFQFTGLNGSWIENVNLRELHLNYTAGPDSDLWTCVDIENSNVKNNSVTPWPPCSAFDIVPSARTFELMLPSALLEMLDNKSVSSGYRHLDEHFHLVLVALAAAWLSYMSRSLFQKKA